MTALREQLRVAHAVHHQAYYPGDLAAEVLPGGAVRWRIALGGALAAGVVAAALVLGMLVLRPMLTPAKDPSRPQLPVVRGVHLTPRMQFSLPSLPSVAGFGSRLAFPPALPTPSLSLPMRVPSLSGLSVPALPHKPELT